MLAVEVAHITTFLKENGVLDDNYLAITAIVTVLYQFIWFVIAAVFKTDKVSDFAGTTNYMIVALLTATLHNTWYLRQMHGDLAVSAAMFSAPSGVTNGDFDLSPYQAIILVALVVTWAFRLGLYCLVRILQWGEDWRFDGKRDDPLQFASIWILQAVWIWTVSLPVVIVNASDRNPDIQAVDIIGWAMWFTGFIFEAVADQQKLAFKNNPSKKGKWCDAGLWAFTRHPNYFGEMLLWWGIFVASVPVLKGGQWAVIAGPIFITALLLFLSGVPVLEASNDKRFGGLAEYRRYKNRTSPLVPLPRAVYGNLPHWVKKSFLFELPFYSKVSSD